MCVGNKTVIKILNIASLMTLVVATTMVITVVYWLAYPYKPAAIKSIRVEDTTIAAGSALYLDVDYCKYMEITPLITTAFVDGVIFYLNDTFITIPVGCGVNRVSILVPQEMASGAYSIRRAWTYQVNPLRRMTIVMESNEFEITGSDSDRQHDQE